MPPPLPRQLLRLKETRKGEAFTYQTPAQIATLPDTTALTQQDFQNSVLSQVKQILGTSRWNDPVPESLADVAAAIAQLTAQIASVTTNAGVSPANCKATDAVGDCVYLTAATISGRWQVSRVDNIADYTKLPVVGILVQKYSDTICDVRWSGEARIFSGLMAGKNYFLEPTGRIGLAAPSTTGQFVQLIGTAVSETSLLLNINPTVTRRA